MAADVIYERSLISISPEIFLGRETASPASSSLVRIMVSNDKGLTTEVHSIKKKNQIALGLNCSLGLGLICRSHIENYFLWPRGTGHKPPSLVFVKRILQKSTKDKTNKNQTRLQEGIVDDRMGRAVG